MNTNKKTPKLRFKGFTDDWEQRKFDEIYERSGRKNDLTYGIDKIISVANMYFKTDAIVGSEKYLKTYNVFKLGDIAFEGHTNKEYSYGRFVENTIGDGIISHIFDVFTPKINLDINFWKDLIKYEPIMGPILRRCTKASRMMSNLTSKEFLEEKILCPTLEEQKLIGGFIVRLDKNITLHQRKLEKLKLNKSALLQKLFPQKGCTIPDVRFKGFTDAWEQRKLNDFGIATGGTSIESEFVDGGTYKVINIGSYSEESVYNDQGLRVNKTDKTKSRILNKYDLTMILNDKTASGNIIGRVLLIDQDNTYVYNQRTERIEVDTKNFLPMFLYHMLNAPEQRKYIVKASQGNTQIYVNWSTISNIDYMIPQLLLEQEKIANLFSLINKDITLHQRKLDCLISIKKGLLQQLFV